MQTINFNTSSIKEPTSSIGIKAKEDPNTHTMYKEATNDKHVGKARESGDLFHLVTNSKFK